MKTPEEIRQFKEKRYARLGAIAKQDNGQFYSGRVLRLFEKMLKHGLNPDHDIFTYSHHPFGEKGNLTSMVDVVINGQQDHYWFVRWKTQKGSLFCPRGPKTFKGQVRSLKRSRGGLKPGETNPDLWVMGGQRRYVRNWSRDASTIQRMRASRSLQRSHELPPGFVRDAFGVVCKESELVSGSVVLKEISELLNRNR